MRQYSEYLAESKKHPHNADLCGEVITNIDQLEYSLESVMALESKYSSLTKKRTENAHKTMKLINDNSIGIDERSRILDVLRNEEREESDLNQLEEEDVVFKMRFYTETFYYMAYRIRLLVRDKAKPLPGLEFFEGKAVAQIRDQLLFHPEDKKSQAFQQSFRWGKETGPQLKPNSKSSSNVQVVDKGLYSNAKEFKDELETCVQTFLNTNNVTAK
ncbi:hypothetical protein EKL32_22595 [Flavobacterium sp. GSN2]|nr:hypothetical protein EKL32_22595 [Flavobacterium sp. GSN2]